MTEKNNTLRPNWKVYLIPLLLLVLCTSTHINQGDFRKDTARYAAVGLQMWETGEFISPYLHQGNPYFKKPPLPFWIHGLFLKTLGVHVWSARLPSIIAAAGCVLLTLLIVQMMGTKTLAFASACILATTYEFFRRSREISLDMWQLLFMLAAAWAILTAIKHKRYSLIGWAGVPIGLSLLCKPLNGLFLFVIFIIWLIMAREARQLWRLIITLMITAIVSIPWHAMMVYRHGTAFIQCYFGAEIIDHAQGELCPSPPWYYYFKEMSLTYWPWMIVFLFGIYLMVALNISKKAPLEGRASAHPLSQWRSLKLWRTCGSTSLQGCHLGVKLAFAWVACWFIALNLFPDKRPQYELPLYPMMSWVSAYGLIHITFPAFSRWYHRGYPWLIPSLLSIFVILNLLPMQVQSPPEEKWPTLFAEMEKRSLTPSQLWEGAMGDNDACRFYLETGEWLNWPWANGGQILSHMPEKSLLVYDTDLSPSPGPNEIVVFQVDNLMVTYLTSTGWKPTFSKQ